MAGTFLVVGLGEESFTSLTPEQVQKYTEHFKQPEQFINLNGQIIALPVEPENPLRTVEMTLEDDYGMIDGVLNNGRKGEEQEKAQGKAHRSAPEKRPSIRERLAEAKRECGERKPPGQGPAEEAPGARSGGWNGPSSSGRTAAAGTTRFARAVSIPASPHYQSARSKKCGNRG